MTVGACPKCGNDRSFSIREPLTKSNNVLCDKCGQVLATVNKEQALRGDW